MFKKSNLFLCTLLILAEIQVEGRKLMMVQQIFRHGARYPIFHFGGDNSQFAKQQKQLGELTLQGKHMQFVLGKLMYEKYWSQLFEGTPYLDKYHPSQFYVKSTNVNRTIQSAEAQLLGLFQNLPPSVLPTSAMNYSMPPMAQTQGYEIDVENSTEFQVYGGKNSDFHLIPIHMEKSIKVPNSSSYPYRANPYDEGEFLSKYEKENCPNQKFWSKQNMASDQARQIKKSDQVKKFLAELSAEVGEDVKYQIAYKYVDNYYCEIFMGLKTLNVFKSPANLRVADFIFLSSTIFDKFYTEQQIKTSNSQLLEHIVYNIKQRIIDKGPRMILYSAHDTTLLSLASALNFVNMDCLLEYFYNGVNNSQTCINQYPVFASNFIVELWEQDNLSHSISILYNGVARKIPICGGATSCPFADFEQWVQDFVIEDPNKVCGIHQRNTKLYIVIAILSILAFIFIICYFRAKLKKKNQKDEKEVQVESQKKGYYQQFDEKEPGGSNKDAMQNEQL